MTYVSYLDYIKSVIDRGVAKAIRYEARREVAAAQARNAGKLRWTALRLMRELATSTPRAA